MSVGFAIATSTLSTPVLASEVVIDYREAPVVVDSVRTFTPDVTRRLQLRPDRGNPLRQLQKSFPRTMTQYIWPAKGKFTSGFGPRRGRMHRGIDIAAPTGTPVIASASGVVKRAGWNNGGYGQLVEIRHPDGNYTRYGHNSRILVRQGQPVLQGEQIAKMGSTGRSTGPHTHFEIRRPGQGAVNPLRYLRNRG